MKKIYNMVYSMKGGCGKTAFSIKLARKFFGLMEERRNNPEKYVTDSDKMQVCLIDLDVTGSSMMNTFFSIASEESIDNLQGENLFVNDISKYPIKHTFFIKKISKHREIRIIESSEEEIVPDTNSADFNVLFASPRLKDIKKFRIDNDYNFNPIISYDSFANNFADFLTSNNEFGKVQNIIFDMSPGADGFSSVVFDMLFGKDSKEKSNHIKKYKGDYRIVPWKTSETVNIKNLYYVMDLDSGHIYALKREMEKWFIKSEMELPENIFIVINNTCALSSDEFNELIKNRADDIYTYCTSILKLDKKILDRIYFIRMEYDKEYLNAINKGIGLYNNVYWGNDNNPDFRYNESKFQKSTLKQEEFFKIPLGEK